MTTLRRSSIAGVLDLSPVAVSGARDAARARVIWRDGTLVVFTTRNDETLRTRPLSALNVETIPAERPVKVGRDRWAVSTDQGDLEMVKSCGCGGTNPLGRIARHVLLAHVPAS